MKATHQLNLLRRKRQDVASCLRLEHILHWFVLTLSHAHQSGLLTRRVPKNHELGTRRVANSLHNYTSVYINIFPTCVPYPHTYLPYLSDITLCYLGELFHRHALLCNPFFFVRYKIYFISIHYVCISCVSAALSPSPPATPVSPPAVASPGELAIV